jgi:hypothetical protein
MMFVKTLLNAIFKTQRALQTLWSRLGMLSFLIILI